MKYEIKGGQLPVVICNLSKGESLFTERGAMSWMDEGISMSTNAQNGFSRMFSGDSIFQNVFEAEKDDVNIAFASSFPGQILAFDVSNETIIAQKRSFLAREKSVKMSIFFQKKFGAGLFGGEGFIMQKFEGQGHVFLEIDGTLMEYDLAEGQSMIIDTGYLAAMSSTVKMDIQAVKGFKNAVFGGEGIFNTKVTGPGKIWIQTMPLSKIASLFSHK